MPFDRNSRLCQLTAMLPFDYVCFRIFLNCATVKLISRCRQSETYSLTSMEDGMTQFPLKFLTLPLVGLALGLSGCITSSGQYDKVVESRRNTRYSGPMAKRIAVNFPCGSHTPIRGNTKNMPVLRIAMFVWRCST